MKGKGIREGFRSIIGRLKQAEAEQQAAVATTYRELVRQAAAFEFDPDNAPEPAVDDHQVKQLLEATGKTADDLEADVAQEVRAAKLRVGIDKIPDIKQRMQSLSSEMEEQEAALKAYEENYIQHRRQLVEQYNATERELRAALHQEGELRKLCTVEDDEVENELRSRLASARAELKGNATTGAMHGQVEPPKNGNVKRYEDIRKEL